MTAVHGRSPCARRLGGAATTLLLTAAVGGCAGWEDYGSAAWDPARMPGTAEVAERTRYVDHHYLRPEDDYREAVAARIAELAREPMTEAAAIEVALLRDHGIRQLLTEPWKQGPSFVAAVAESAADAGDPRPTEWKVVAQILSESPTGRWEREFGEEYLETAETVLAKTARVRRAYYEAVAAAQLAAMFDQVLEADEAAAVLVNEQYRAGTASRFDQARQHLAYAETFKATAAARHDAIAAREELNRILKLHGDQTAWELPERLPDLPAERPVLGDVEAYAVRHSPAAYTGRAGLDQVEAGAVLRSEVREAYSRLLTAYDIARYQRDVVVPLTQVALMEAQLNYNAMLDDVYGLLEATREQIQAGKEYVTTLAEFWVASAGLARSMGGRLPEAAPAATRPTTAAADAAPQADPAPPTEEAPAPAATRPTTAAADPAPRADPPRPTEEAPAADAAPQADPAPPTEETPAPAFDAPPQVDPAYPVS